MYMNLCNNIINELSNCQNEFHYFQRPLNEPSPILTTVLQRYCITEVLDFHGFCLDEGAPFSVVGLNQWIAYLHTHNLPYKLLIVTYTQNSIAFEGKGKEKVNCHPMGLVTIRVPLSDINYFDYRSLLIHNDFPMLIGLRTQTRLRALTGKDPYNLSITLRSLNITLFLVIKDQHLCYEGPPKGDYLFNSAKLAQVHRNLGHAPAGAVDSALRPAYPIETDATDLDKLKQVAAQCKGCQMYSRQPNRYRAVFPAQCVLNYDVAVDVMYIDKNPILHVVCRQTHFSRAAILYKQDSYTIWQTFITIWATPYFGVPYNLWVDQAKAFLSVQFSTLANSLECNLVKIAVEAHWPLMTERYHDPLRRITKKLMLDHPHAPLSLILDYENLVMSHTTGPEGFTPAILAFDAQPRLPLGNHHQQPQSVVNRMDLVSTAR